jgi:hypothetical protein
VHIRHASGAAATDAALARNHYRGADFDKPRQSIQGQTLPGGPGTGRGPVDSAHIQITT